MALKFNSFIREGKMGCDDENKNIPLRDRNADSSFLSFLFYSSLPHPHHSNFFLKHFILLTIENYFLPESLKSCFSL